jgi:hypothetical protein
MICAFLELIISHRWLYKSIVWCAVTPCSSPNAWISGKTYRFHYSESRVSQARHSQQMDRTAYQLLSPNCNSVTIPKTMLLKRTAYAILGLVSTEWSGVIRPGIWNSSRPVGGILYKTRKERKRKNSQELVYSFLTSMFPLLFYLSIYLSIYLYLSIYPPICLPFSFSSSVLKTDATYTSINFPESKPLTLYKFPLSLFHTFAGYRRTSLLWAGINSLLVPFSYCMNLGPT